VITTQDDDKVAVLLGDGKGSFLRHVNSPFSVITPQGANVGDFNEDGYTDIVVDNWLNTRGTTVSILFNDQGTGSFSPPMAIEVGLRSPQSNAVADFNDDGHLDIAVANWGDGLVTMIFGNGDGTFAPDRPRFGVQIRPHSITAADLNNDGLPDLITGNSPSHTISILINDSSNPGRQFTSTTLDSRDGVGRNPAFIAVGDFDNDGHRDFVTRSEPDQVQVFLNDGDGSGKNYSLVTQFAVGNNPRVTLADIDSDGSLDIVSANLNDNTVSIHLNDGTGASFVPGEIITVNQPVSVIAADLNNDDTQDIVAINKSGSVTILLNDGSGSFGAPTVIPVGESPSSIVVAELN